MSAAGFGDVAAAEKAGARRSFPSLANNRPSPIAPPTDSAVSCFHASGEPLHSAAVIRRISIVDYGMGNLGSVAKALKYLNYDSVITGDPEVISASSGVILPGVGAFAPAMENLRNKGLDSVIIESAYSGKPFLGICLGMQLLMEGSQEGLNLP